MARPTYILGVGLSHDGSAVLLRDGEVLVGIEKERVSRVKHDGGNDTLAALYCLKAAGISPSDLAMVVQCANFEVPDRNAFNGPRVWSAFPKVPIVSISHHLAHAYSAIGTCPFDEFHVLVVDGCGSPMDQCADLADHRLSDPPLSRPLPPTLLCEKDSFYHWDGQRLRVLWKDFSEMAQPSGGRVSLPTTQHSIGGFYAAVSHYCFGNMSDAGKLMGLAPYGKGSLLTERVFDWEEGRLKVRDGWKDVLTKPASSYGDFRSRFDYFAQVASWAQQEVEYAVSELVRRRMERFGRGPLAYTGGVALNAVANGRLLREKTVDQLYLEPAAGDNGLALGCAYFGWLDVLKKPRVPTAGNTCFGRTYASDEVARSVAALPPAQFEVRAFDRMPELLNEVADALQHGLVVGWFQGGAEFGPRALGHRSILAAPGIPGMRDRINRTVKFREDFRPFAPAVLKEDASLYFLNAWESPYMILVDQVKPEWHTKLESVVHVNGSARVQTVDESWNAPFCALLRAVKSRSGHGILLNTSFNKKGQPIVEQPAEAVALLVESSLDVLVVEGTLVRKRPLPRLP